MVCKFSYKLANSGVEDALSRNRHFSECVTSNDFSALPMAIKIRICGTRARPYRARGERGEGSVIDVSSSAILQ